jgi:hypothetical protein
MPAHPYTSAGGGNPEQPLQKRKKQVTWNNHSLEQVKYFKQNDEPSAAGLSLQEVQEI